MNFEKSHASEARNSQIGPPEEIQTGEITLVFPHRFFRRTTWVYGPKRGGGFVAICQNIKAEVEFRAPRDMHETIVAELEKLEEQLELGKSVCDTNDVFYVYRTTVEGNQYWDGRAWAPNILRVKYYTQDKVNEVYKKIKGHSTAVARIPVE